MSKLVFTTPPQAQQAVIFVGALQEEWDSPAHNLYSRLPEELILRRITSLRIQYRCPNDLGESILDVLAGITFLRSQGIDSIGLVGHSFGGAVALQTAAASPCISTVITLATQAFGAEAASNIYNRPLLFLHGGDDEVLPSYCSTFAYTLANDPKELMIIDGATHALDEASQEIYYKVRTWLLNNLQPHTLPSGFLTNG